MKRQRERVHRNARCDGGLAPHVHNPSTRVGCFPVSNSFLIFLLAIIFANFPLRTILSLTDFYPNESERNPMTATSPMDGCGKVVFTRSMQKTFSERLHNGVCHVKIFEKMDVSEQQTINERGS